MTTRFKQSSNVEWREWPQLSSKNQNRENGNATNKTLTEYGLPLVEAKRTSTVSKLNPQSRLLTQLSSVPLLQLLHKCWDNSSFRSKLVVALVASAALPAIVGTSGVLALLSHRMTLERLESVRGNLSVLEQDLAQIQQSNKVTATSLAQVVLASRLELTDFDDIKATRNLVKQIGQGGQSFRIITDAFGKTVAQNIQILGEDLSDAPPLPLAGQSFRQLQYHTVSLPAGIALGDIPIVKDALKSGRILSGTELWSGDDIVRLGLEKQATIGFHSQKFQWLNKSQRPFEDGTVFKDTDSGHAGLVLAAVQPIRAKGSIVGAAIVGTLLNRNFQIIDQLKQKTGVETASLFAQDSMVSTNVPYPDDNSRAIGTKAASGVADAVVNRGEKFVGQTNVLQDDYLTAYGPLYDHRHRPVGMAYVGDSQAKVISSLAPIWQAGYGFGGGMLLLVGLVAVPVASTFCRPIRRITTFAQLIGSGQPDARLETDRRDEIGGLSHQLNHLAGMIELSQEAVQSLDSLRRQTSEQIRLFAAIPERIRQDDNLQDILTAAVEEIRAALKIERVLICRGSIDTSASLVAAESVASWQSKALGVEIPTDYVHNGVSDCYIKLSSDSVVAAKLVAPIVVNNEVFAWLIAHDSRLSMRIEQSAIDLFTQAGTQIGIALSQRLVLEQLEKAQIAAELVSLQQQQQKEYNTQQLLGLLKDVESVSDGDLTAKAEVTTGEIGTVADFFNFTIENLRQLVTHVKLAASLVSSSIGENALSLASLTLSAKNQAEQIALLLGAVEDSMRSLEIVAQNARTALDFAHSVSTTAEVGEAAMDGTVQSILNLRSTVAQTATKVHHIGESSEQISRAVFSINQIALQTNILAINLSIEAARAGEAGRGFAVVATEVGGLAGQIAAFTKQIDKNVHEIQLQKSEVASGIGVVTEQAIALGESLEDKFKNYTQIFEQSSQASDLVQSVATSSMSQAQISAVLAQMLQAIARNSAHLSDESKNLHEDLQHTVAVDSLLQRSVGTFKLDAEN